MANEVLKKNTMQKGVVACVCNKCDAKVEVSTQRFYAPVSPAKDCVKDKDGKIISEFIPKGSLTHRYVSGGACDGTLKTATNTKKTKSHKPSRDRAIKSKQK
jgi:hypothetical protein